MNTHKKNQPGEHWLAIFFDDKRRATFFDSYGFSPKSYGLDAYLKQHSKKMEYNDQQIQGITSSTCGYYCCYFIQLKCRNFSLKEILDHFDKRNFDFNDNRILKLF